ncbi:hypothetical protein [Luteimonas sp. YGD11-2]|uniref:hypothetical protein n=1 Tax=Luteimonas sp. YGD11-2 TaxID=2508168 RepID=UPI00100B89BF|nr:hypothetical protein [Luteimonas sp. YGD11-2]
MKSTLVLALAAAMTASALSACGERAPPSPPPAPADSAPPQERVPANDPAVRRHERAAPPELQALVSGRFEPRGERATRATGAIEVDDHAISAAQGDELSTERIAIVRGDDQYRAGERYSSLLMVGAEQPVELRRVYPPAGDTSDDDPLAADTAAVEGTPPVSAGVPAGIPADAAADRHTAVPLCASGEASYIALVMVNEGDRQVVRLAGLRGDSMPAAGASDIEACEVLEYESR